jgi:hypothetical protein
MSEASIQRGTRRAARLKARVGLVRAFAVAGV